MGGPRVRRPQAPQDATPYTVMVFPPSSPTSEQGHPSFVSMSHGSSPLSAHGPTPRKRPSDITMDDLATSTAYSGEGRWRRMTTFYLHSCAVMLLWRRCGLTCLPDCLYWHYAV